MSIQQEEITIKEFTTGTTLVLFSTHLDGIIKNTDILSTPSIVWLNNFNIPVKITTFDGDNLWVLNTENNYIPIENLTNNYITGHSFTQTFKFPINDSKYNSIKNRFSQQITESLTTGATITTSNGIIPNPNPPTVPGHTDFVFREFNPVDDFFVNIKLNRTFSTLDTLNIYNNIVNSIPTQKANTGVVFGRILALQNIKDSKGNNIKIPLRNVPIGIFNPSDDYPTSASITDNGDRIFLNIKESSQASDYFNNESFELDKNTLLRSASQFTTVPDQYKYITITNDEGEFVIYDAPIGTQIVMFEVDLLKQGLTKDEIALNFFQFPADNDAIIDQIPNFAFKQFPIDVVPSWGTIQTGYTELNVTVNMDLRKWTTYFIPPVSMGGLKLETAVAQSAANSLQIVVRNMAKEGYPKTNIKMATIPNDLDRVFGQQLNWNLEFAQIRNFAEYFKFGISIIKLPANIYDPNSYKTDNDGFPMIRPSQKGVWLSAYQLKIFSNSNKKVSRMTGTFYINPSLAYSHFNLTYTEDNILNQNDTQESLNKFPYEKPWSLDYPNKYSIPSKPTQRRFFSDKTNGRTETSPGSNEYFIDEPSFSDGDIVGNLVGSIAGGFGMMSSDDIWIPNRVAHAITKDFMYKYESEVAINEIYANGYQPSNPNYANFPGVSKVIGGEKYQRLECGYGYFCKPQGWPRVATYPWGGDALYKPDVTGGVGLTGIVATPGPGWTPPNTSLDGLKSTHGHTNDIYNIKAQDPALSLDRNNALKNAGIDFFRVINASANNLTPIEPFVIPTFAKLHTSDGVADRLEKTGFFSLKNLGEIDVDVPYWLNPTGSNYPIWTPTQGFHTGTSRLRPGETLFIYGQQPASHAAILLRYALDYTSVILPANSSFNLMTNRFDKADYEISLVYKRPYYQGGPGQRTAAISMNANVTPPTYWLKTLHSGGASGLKSVGINSKTCSLGRTCRNDFGISGMVIEPDNSIFQS